MLKQLALALIVATKVRADRPSARLASAAVVILKRARQPS